jgi:hypothetical protein
MGTLALILIPAALFVGTVALVLALRNGRVVEPGRPWWGHPGAWIAVSTVFVLLGVMAFPRLLGFTFVFLPLIWMRGFGRRREPRDPGPHENDPWRDEDDRWPSEDDRWPREDDR